MDLSRYDLRAVDAKKRKGGRDEESTRRKHRETDREEININNNKGGIMMRIWRFGWANTTERGGDRTDGRWVAMVPYLRFGPLALMAAAAAAAVAAGATVQDGNKIRGWVDYHRRGTEMVVSGDGGCECEQQ
jgi:hypothetical protein